MSGPERETLNLDELFDVVDANDQVIDRQTRREVHARNLLHRATHVMIYNLDGHLFLQRRSMKKDTFPGCWDSSCSGHVEAGEDYFTAARRELVEEIGWHNTTMPLRPVIKLPASPETGYEFIQVYLLGPTIGPFDLNPEEISEAKWVLPVELDIMINQEPETVAGALRFAWLYHREEYLARIWRGW